MGSPPPMRGKVKFKTDLFSFSRITPAYAGKSLLLLELPAVRRDHPRLCGEKLYMPLWVSPRAGSPPPMRGKAVLRTTFSHTHRITPAYAGKSVYQHRGILCLWDHPRLCGEKRNHENRSRLVPGSPPPMRGKGKQAAQDLFDNRITPAYAGKRYLKSYRS